MEVFTNTPRVLDSSKKTASAASLQPQPFLPLLRAQRTLRAAGAGTELGVEDEGYYDGEKTPTEIDDFRRPHDPGQQQVHSLPPLRGGLRECPGHRRHRRQQPRLCHADRLRLRAWDWERPPACPADSASPSAPPALSGEGLHRGCFCGHRGSRRSM